MRRPLAAALLTLAVCAGFGAARVGLHVPAMTGMATHRVADDANPPLPYGGSAGSAIPTAPTGTNGTAATTPAATT